MTDYLQTWSNHPLGQAHVALALLALALGPIALGVRKGGRHHRAVGYAYVVAMLAVNASALFRYGLTGGFNLFHAAALASLATLLPAWLCAWRARALGSRALRVAHGIFMSWSYFGLVMAFFAELATRRFPALLHGQGGWLRFSVVLGVSMLVFGLLVQRWVRSRIVDPGSPGGLPGPRGEAGRP